MAPQARTLDIIICGFEPADGTNPPRVYYGFPVPDSDTIVNADMYREGQFDLSTIEIGKRYEVRTKKMMCLVWSKKAQDFLYKERFVWVKATERVPKAKLKALTAKQREAAEARAAMLIVDNGELFTF